MRVGKFPAAITRRAGQGRVGEVMVTPLGDPPKGTTPFWDWPDWNKVMEGVVRELLGKQRNSP